MGNQANCCAPDQRDMPDYESAEMVQGDAISPSIERMNILEYEQRVKQYASPENYGYINEV